MIDLLTLIIKNNIKNRIKSTTICYIILRVSQLLAFSSYCSPLLWVESHTPPLSFPLLLLVYRQSEFMIDFGFIYISYESIYTFISVFLKFTFFVSKKQFRLTKGMEQVILVYGKWIFEINRCYETKRIWQLCKVRNFFHGVGCGTMLWNERPFGETIR